MARVTVEDCLQKVENRFSLVHLAVRRVLQLRKGAAPLEDSPKNKEVVLALREIAAGSVTTQNVAEYDVVPALPEPPPSPAQREAYHREVAEVLEDETRYDANVEFEPDVAPPEETE